MEWRRGFGWTAGLFVDQGTMPASAAVQERNGVVWVIKLCIDRLFSETRSMDPYGWKGEPAIEVRGTGFDSRDQEWWFCGCVKRLDRMSAPVNLESFSYCPNANRKIRTSRSQPQLAVKQSKVILAQIELYKNSSSSRMVTLFL